MALIGLIAGRSPGSTLGLAKLLSFTIIPVFIVGPLAGVYVDRWDRRKTLLVCDILRGVLVLLIPFALMNRASLVPIYLVVFLIFCLSRFYVPAKMSIIPDLVEKKDLLIANSLVSVTGMIAFVLGCALGGILVERFGSKGGFICDAATFFLSAGLILTINPNVRFKFDRSAIFKTSREMIQVIRKSIWVEMGEGVTYLFKKREIRFIVWMLFILLSAGGAVYVVIIVFIQQAFGSVTKHLGFLAVFLGVGLFIGSLLYGRYGEKVSRTMIMFLCLLLGGFMVIIFAFIVEISRNVGISAGLSFVLGVITGPIFIAANTIVHQVSDDHMRGKVFSGLEIVIHLAFLFSMLISSVLSEVIGHYWILIGVGFVFSSVGVYGLLKYGGKNDLLKV